MTPDEFKRHISRHEPGGVYLFLGPEHYLREGCRRALIDRALPAEERAEGITHLDLDEMSVAAVLDDARSLSLFATRRVIWVSTAEAALPRGRAAASSVEESDDDDEGSEGGASAARRKSAAGGIEAALAAYAKEPTPGTVVVFDAARFDFEGEDKARCDRVRKFYAAAEVVEFPRFTAVAARSLAQRLAVEAGLTLAPGAAETLADALANDAARIAVEIEKLSLFAGPGTVVGEQEIAVLVPNARAATIFNLVAALGRRDRVRSLELLDTLVREGEYLPLALSFIGTQFRMALAAREAGLSNAAQIQAHFTRLGVPMWRSRAEQVQQTIAAFPAARLARGMGRVFAADRALRDVSPDDRIAMEAFILALTE
jgi:DNA polymerase III subunit delta